MGKRVAVVMGGPSAEHEISLKTGLEMIKHIDKDKYSPYPVVISKDKLFYAGRTLSSLYSEENLNFPEKSDCFNGPFLPYDGEQLWKDCDIALLALHGEAGEDGKFQGYLETMGIPYTGSGVLASALGMNKIVSKILFEKDGIITPPWSVFSGKHSTASIDAIEKKHGYPCFVKCPQSGSSRLMGKADQRTMLEDMITEFSRHTDEILIETCICGDEFSCPVLEYPDGSVRPLLPIMIKPVAASFFDYTAKYTKGGSEEIVPAPISHELTEKLQCIALKAHSALKCRGVTRTDMIVQDSVIYVLEINTLPGFTSASLVPKAFAAMRGKFPELLDIIIETALARKCI